MREAAATVEGIERVQLQVGAMNPQQRSALRSMLSRTHQPVYRPRFADPRVRRGVGKGRRG